MKEKKKNDSDQTCVKCHFPLKDSNWANKGSTHFCNQKDSKESNSALNKIFEQINKKNESADSNQINLGEIPIEEDSDYVSMVHNIPFKNPVIYINNILKSCESELQNALEEFPFLKGRTLAQALADMPEAVIVKNNKIAIAQKMFHGLHSRLLTNFSQHMQKCMIFRNKTLIESQLVSIRELLLSFSSEDEKNANQGIKIYKSVKIEEVYGDNNLNKEDVESVISIFEQVTTLIPDKYKKSVPPLTVLVRNANSSAPSAASITGDDAVIVLNKHNNSLVQAAEGLHEYIHLLEKFNENIRNHSNSFLKERILLFEKLTLGQIQEKYKKHCRPSAQDILVYPTDLIDPYAGRTYGDLNEKESVHSEVLTVGCEAMILAPHVLLISDPAYFDFVSKLLLQKI